MHIEYCCVDFDSSLFNCLQWFKSQKVGKPVRILPAPTSSIPSESQASNSRSQFSESGSLSDLRVTFSGLPKDTMAWSLFLLSHLSIFSSVMLRNYITNWSFKIFLEVLCSLSSYWGWFCRKNGREKLRVQVEFFMPRSRKVCANWLTFDSYLSTSSELWLYFYQRMMHSVNCFA